MIDQDKFGRKIHPKVFDTLRYWGVRLSRCGYKESKNKPNLFYKKIENKAIFFADMRGTEEVPIWEEPVPLLYWQFLDDVSPRLQNKMIEAEFKVLKKFKIKYRLSYEFEHALRDKLIEESCSEKEKVVFITVMLDGEEVEGTFLPKQKELIDEAVNFYKIQYGEKAQIVIEDG